MGTYIHIHHICTTHTSSEYCYKVNSNGNEVMNEVIMYKVDKKIYIKQNFKFLFKIRARRVLLNR